MLLYEKWVWIMHEKIGTGGTALGERAKQTFRQHRLIAEAVLYVLIGYASANAFVLGGLAPFGVAFAAGAKPKNTAAAILGASIGYLVSFRVMTNIKYILAMVILFLVRWCFSSGSIFSSIKIPAQLLAAISLGIPGFLLTFMLGNSIYGIMLAAAESLLAACAAYFFVRTIQAFDLGIKNLKQSDITSIIITFCISILALTSWTIFGVSIGRILAVAVILLSAQAAQEAGGAIAGVAAGVCVGLLGSDNHILMGTYGFGGLLAGVFAPLGKIPSAGVFIVINTFAVLVSMNALDYKLLVEIFIACLIVIFIPRATIQRWLSPKASGSIVAEDTYKSVLSNKISYISDALRDVATTTRQVNEKLSGMVNGDISSVYHAAAERICRYCNHNTVCWQQKYTDTSNVLGDCITVLRQSGSLTESDFPHYFRNHCTRLPELILQIQRHYEEYTTRESMRRKVAQVRGVVTDQFEGMAMMIDAMGNDLGELAIQDRQTAEKVKEYMHSLSIYPDDVLCTIDPETNMTLGITIPIYKLTRIDMATLTADLCDICKREFDFPAKDTIATKSLVKLTFTEKATYTVKWGASQLGNKGSKLCGDSYSYVNSRNGRVNIILSDGMGSGGSAAVDSTMTAELLKRLIEAGISLDAALKLVNSALLVKSGDESLATIDITGIDLYTGQVDFYKAGAAPTFIRKSGKGGYVQSNSLPVGILNGVTFEHNAVMMRAGDLVIMVSDGAVAQGHEWLISDIEHFSGDDPKLLSENIVNEAYRRRVDGHQDDITAIVIMIEKGI